MIDNESQEYTRVVMRHCVLRDAQTPMDYNYRMKMLYLAWYGSRNGV